jgi:hypothetical protein
MYNMIRIRLEHSYNCSYQLSITIASISRYHQTRFHYPSPHFPVRESCMREGQSDRFSYRHLYIPVSENAI